MGRKNKQKLAKRQQGKAQGGNREGKIPPPFVPSKELAATLENLSIATTGTAEDHGLVGDCPYCLEPLPPYWIWEDTSFKRNTTHIFMCCGKCCCMYCRREILQKLTGNSHQDLVQNPNSDAIPGGEVRTIDPSCDVDNHVKQLWGSCPFCRSSILGNGEFGKVQANIAEYAERGHGWAQYIVAMGQLKKSDGPTRAAGIEELHKAAISGYPHAVYSLAVYYCDGNDGMKKNPKMGNKLLDLAFKQGNVEAGMNLSVRYRRSGQFAKALEYGQKASDLGCSKSSTFLSDVYNGMCGGEDYGVQEDPSIAFKYMKLAADQGDAKAQYVTALQYKNVLRDEEKGAYYLQMAVDQGNAEAQYMHGSGYVLNEDGDVLLNSENWCQGVHWLRLARKGGSMYAAVDLLKIEPLIASLCFNCGAKVVDKKEFNKCSKCKTVAYCSVECQIEAWKGGHKEVCVKYDG